MPVQVEYRINFDYKLLTLALHDLNTEGDEPSFLE
jgi:hypothetical protein